MRYAPLLFRHALTPDPCLLCIQERLALAQEKKAVEQSRSSLLCVSCRTPIKDTGPSHASAQGEKTIDSH